MMGQKHKPSEEEHARCIAFGQRLRRARWAANLTQEELAGTYCTKGFVSQMERGEIWPSMSTLFYLSRTLGIKASWLLDEDEAAQR